MRSTIRAGGIDAVVGVLLAMPLIGLGIATFVFGAESGRAPWATAAYDAIGVLSIAAAVVFPRHLARPGPRLRVKVSQDMIVCRQRGRPKAKFWRDDIEMIVIEQGLDSRTCFMWVYGPVRSVLDAWQTGWIAGSKRKVFGALERDGYPFKFRLAVPRPRPPADDGWATNDRRRVRTDGPFPLTGH